MSKPLRILGIAGSLRSEVMIAKAHERFDPEGNLTEEKTKELIRRLLQGLVDWARRIGQQS